MQKGKDGAWLGDVAAGVEEIPREGELEGPVTYRALAGACGHGGDARVFDGPEGEKGEGDGEQVDCARTAE